MRSFIKELNKDDIETLSSLNNQYASIISEELDYIEDLNNSDNKFYGIFIEDNIIGFCSVCSATEISDGTYWTENSKIISDFFILEQYRNQGYGSELLSEVIKSLSSSEPIYFEAISNTMAQFCIDLGFKDINGDILVLLPNNKEEK